MDQVEAISTLKKEVAQNPAASAVFHVFATRQRARHMVSLRALSQRMEKEGFDFSPTEYSKVLRLLSDCGFGKLEKNKRGKVTALVEVKTTLQSLGAAVLGQQKKVDAYHRRQMYKDVVAVSQAVKKSPQTLTVYPYRASSTVSITLTINGKPIIVPIPGELTPEEIAGLIAHFQASNSSTGKESS